MGVEIVFMKKLLALIFAIIGWFAVIGQFILMMENRVAPILETCIRFFSFFTILTNGLVAIYFTLSYFNNRNKLIAIKEPGTLTAMTVYITVVGLVYQVVLRQLWQPQGLQWVVNELLHTLIPILVILFWYLYENKSPIKYTAILKWLIYPLIYLIYILIRGRYSGFYPYPFVDVSQLGLSKVLINSAVLMVIFAGLSALFIRVGKFIKT